MTGGQLVTMSLVAGTVDSNVVSKCHLCWTPPLPTGLGQQLRALCLESELEKIKNKSGVSMSLSVPLDKGDRVGIGCRMGGLFVPI